MADLIQNEEMLGPMIRRVIVSSDDIIKRYSHLQKQKLNTSNSISQFFLIFPISSISFESGFSRRIGICAAGSRVSLAFGSLYIPRGASCSTPFPYADRQIPDELGGMAKLVIFPTLIGIISNPELVGASARGSITGQQVPGDGILGDGGNGEIRVLLNELDEVKA